ncbi:hypothetical protein Hanom_Chr07g00621261 [Helianthus anomalus]
MLVFNLFSNYCLGKFLTLFSFSEALKKPEVKTKEPEPKKSKFTIIPPKSVSEKEVGKGVEKPAGTVPEKEAQKTVEKTAEAIPDEVQGPEVVRITGLDQPIKNK